MYRLPSPPHKQTLHSVRAPQGFALRLIGYGAHVSPLSLETPTCLYLSLRSALTVFAKSLILRHGWEAIAILLWVAILLIVVQLYIIYISHWGFQGELGGRVGRVGGNIERGEVCVCVS